MAFRCAACVASVLGATNPLSPPLLTGGEHQASIRRASGEHQASLTVELSTLPIATQSSGLASCTAGAPTSISPGPTRERSTGRKIRPWAMPKMQMPKN